MRYYAIKIHLINRMLISKLTDAFDSDHDWEENLNYWLIYPINRPNHSWETLNDYSMRTRFPDYDYKSPIQIVFAP